MVLQRRDRQGYRVNAPICKRCNDLGTPAGCWSCSRVWRSLTWERSADGYTDSTDGRFLIAPTFTEFGNLRCYSMLDLHTQTRIEAKTQRAVKIEAECITHREYQENRRAN